MDANTFTLVLLVLGAIIVLDTFGLGNLIKKWFKWLR